MNLLPAFTGSLLGRFRIRPGTAADAPTCQKLSRQFDAELGRVMLPALIAAANKGELYVAELDGSVVGFVNWHERRDGWHTIYELCVHRHYHGTGIGRALLYAVPCPVRLKCTQDNERANAFYRKSGMQWVKLETHYEHGKLKGQLRPRPLNVYERRILSVLCAGNNRRFPDVARKSGMAYGCRHDDTPRDWPWQLDINWKRYEWGDYLRKIARWRPVMALTPDYETPDKHKLLWQIECLKQLGVLRVAVCPKFDGAVADIPQECIVALSVPTSYAGYVPPLEQLRGRKVHLLGGSPVQWFGQVGRGNNKSATGLVAALQGAGAIVVSADGNAHTEIASKGQVWANGRWTMDDANRARAFDLYTLATISGQHITEDLEQAATVKQMALF